MSIFVHDRTRIIRLVVAESKDKCEQFFKVMEKSVKDPNGNGPSVIRPGKTDGAQTTSEPIII